MWRGRGEKRHAAVALHTQAIYIPSSQIEDAIGSLNMKLDMLMIRAEGEEKCVQGCPFGNRGDSNQETKESSEQETDMESEHEQKENGQNIEMAEAIEQIIETGSGNRQTLKAAKENCQIIKTAVASCQTFEMGEE